MAASAFRVVLLGLAVISARASASAQSEESLTSANPIRKVVSMLQGLQKKIDHYRKTKPPFLEELRKLVGPKGYYPNEFCQGGDDDHNGGRNPCHGWNCCEPFLKWNTCKNCPTDDTCWAAAYYWRLEKTAANGGKMVQVIKDGRLGGGQALEQEMAKELARGLE